MTKDTSVQLDAEATYFTLSIKKTNSSSIDAEEGKNIQLKWDESPSKKAMLTIIDDDGNLKYYTDIYPMALQKNVSISTAVPASFPGKKNYLTWDMIEECKSNGMEILCHTNSHPLSTKISEMTQEDFYADYVTAKEVFAAHGLNSDLLVFSGSTGLYQKAQLPAQQLFKGAFLAGDNYTNQVGVDKHRIKRYRIGSDYPYDPEVLKDLLNSLNETGGWMVWMMHTSNRVTYTSQVPEVLGEAIDYCKELNIPIVTAEYGFSQFCSQE